MCSTHFVFKYISHWIWRSYKLHIVSYWNSDNQSSCPRRLHFWSTYFKMGFLGTRADREDSGGENWMTTKTTQTECSQKKKKNIWMADIFSDQLNNLENDRFILSHWTVNDKTRTTCVSAVSMEAAKYFALSQSKIFPQREHLCLLRAASIVVMC